MSRRALAIAALVVVMACVVRPASGEPEVSKGRRAAAIGAAVVPGLVVHGSGHFVLGERRVARRLLFASGIGLGLVAAGGVPLVLTGASRHYTAVPVAMLVGGVGVFALSWAADLYGATGAAGPRSPLELAPVELELGYGYVYDPRFDYRNFAVTAASVELGWFRVAPVAWIGLDDDNQRLRLEGAYRIGRAPHRALHLGPRGPFRSPFLADVR